MSILKEATFLIDAYNSSHEITGLPALAKRVQTLLLTEPNKIPNLPGAGVGIGNYLFDMADDVTLDKINFAVSENLRLFLPEYTFSSIESKFIKDSSNRTSLAVLIKISSSEEIDKNSFALVFSSERSGNSNIISDFYF